MTIIHYSADTFLSGAALNPSFWQSHSCPTPVHTCLWAGNCNTAQQWLQSGDSSWNSDAFQLVASWSFFWAYLSWQHIARGLPITAKGFLVLQLNAKSKPSPAPDSWMESGNIPGLYCDPSLWEWVWRGVWSKTRGQIWLSSGREVGIKHQRCGLKSFAWADSLLAGHLACDRLGGAFQAQIKLSK